MVANRGAIRQTAAGDALALGAAAALDLGLPLGDLGDLGDFDLEVLRLFFLLLRSLPFESCEVDLAGVALLGLPGFPSCLNLQSFPLLHLPCFQNLQTLLLSPRPEGDLPRLGSRLLSVRGPLATLPMGHLRPYPLKTKNRVTCDPTSFYCACHTKLHLVTCDPTHHY